MEMNLDKTRLQKISVLVIIAMLLNVMAGFLPSGLFANAELSEPQVWRYEENVSSLAAGPEGTILDINATFSAAKTTVYGGNKYTDVEANVGRRYFAARTFLNDPTKGNQKTLSANIALNNGASTYKIEFYVPLTSSPDDPNATFEITDKNGTVITTHIDTRTFGWVTLVNAIELGEQTTIKGIGTTDLSYIRYDSIRFTVTSADVPSPVPSPSPSPSAGPVNVKMYDNGDLSGDTQVALNLPTDVFIPDPQIVFGTSGSGAVSINGRHGFCSTFGASAVYTMKNTSAGKFKVEFLVPLVHANNTNEMHVILKDSMGQEVEKIVDIRDHQQSGASLGGVRTGDWISMGENFVFYNSKAPTVTFELGQPIKKIVGEETKTINEGNFRFDGVRITRVADLDDFVPFAVDLKVDGAILPNETLKGSYTYAHDTDIAQGNTEIKWFTKATESAQYTLKKQGLHTQANILDYTLSVGDMFVKFEVTPKDTTGIIGPKAEMVLKATLPKVRDVAINGRLRPGAELSATYFYSHDGAIAEKDSIYTWYAKADASGTYTQVAQGTTTADTGAKYVVKTGERFIKFQITPKCDTPIISVAQGKAASAEFDVVNDKDSAPVIADLNVTGEAVALGTLRANYTFSDINKDLEKDSQYKWLAASSANATNWRILTTGTGTASDNITYQIPSNFPAGDYIKFEITPKSDAGDSITGVKVTSNVIGPVVMSAIKPEAKDVKFGGYSVGAQGIEGLALNGEAKIEYSYINRTGSPEDSTKTQYQWYVSDNKIDNFTPIDGATTKTYTPSQSLKGKFIKASVVPFATDGGIGDITYTAAVQVKYNLAFYDEFDYVAADGYAASIKEKWNPSSENRVTGGTSTARIPENVEVKDGKMIIHTRKEKHPNYSFDHTWTTASIRSKTTYGPYGYYEAGYKYAHATGLNQSFWTAGGAMTYRPGETQFVEIDVNEGHFPRELKSNLHFVNQNNSRIQNSIGHYPIGENDFFNIKGQTLADNYHVYSAFLKPNDPGYAWNARQNEDTYQVFFDNRKMRSTISLPHDSVAKQNIIFSIAVYPGFGGPLYETETGDPNKPTAHGSKMEVDYVRFYEAVDVSNETLTGAISYGEMIKEQTVIGNGFLQCPQATMTILDNALIAAKAVYNDSNATQQEKEKQAIIVNNAINSIKKGTIFKGTLAEDGVYNISDETITSEIEMTIPSGVDNINIIFPTVAQNKIQIKTPKQVITIAKGTRISGTFTVPKEITYSNSGKTIQYAVSNLGLVAEDGLIQIALLSANGYKIGVLENNQLREITNKINENTLGVASAAIGSGNEVLVYENGNAYVWAKEVGVYVVYKDGVITPTPEPTPTPIDAGNGGSGGGGYYPGGVMPMPKPTDNQNSVNFNDISAHWAKQDILKLAKLNIINGKTNTTFAPDDTMTRAEFAALIRRAVGLNASLYQEGVADVEAGTWYANEIQAILNAGIMSGDANGNFRPNDSISRQEMAKVIVSAYLYKSGAADVTASELTFTDNDTIAGWAKEYVGKALALGLVKGMDDGSFASLSNMTRAQGATVVARIVN